MAIVETPVITPEDLLEITDRPMPELIDGELRERPEMGQKADAIAARTLIRLGAFVETNDLGLVNGAQGSYQIFVDEPRKVRIPDVSFTRKERLPEGPAEGHGRICPDLIVEVVSPNDLFDDLDRKVEDFLGAGVRLAWVVNPETRVVRVHRPDGNDTRLRVGDVLDGGDVLPGFRLDLADLFRGLA